MFNITHRKVGGIHFLAIGQFRISFCRSRKIPASWMPVQL